MIRYTAWIRTASIGLASIASRNAAKSSSLYAVGRHIRGDWLKIWIAGAPALDAALDRLREAAGLRYVSAD